jgi:hypothetical protein
LFSYSPIIGTLTQITESVVTIGYDYLDFIY